MRTLLALMLIAGLAAPARATGRRPCFANQKTVAGALEMYELDTGKPLPDLTPANLEVLRAAGYLQEIPVDPDHEHVGHSHLVLVDPTRYYPACLIHGWLGAKDTSVSPRAQLVEAGVTDAAVLARASPDRWEPAHGDPVLPRPLSRTLTQLPRVLAPFAHYLAAPVLELYRAMRR